MSNLDGNAVQAVAELTKQSVGSFVSKLEPNIEYVYPAFERREAPLRVAEVEAFSLGSLVELVKRHSNGKNAMLLVSENRVQGVVELENYRVIHTLKMPKHPVYSWLERHKSTQTYDHRSLVRLMRTVLANYVDEELVGRLRHIEVTSDGKSSSVLEAGKSGLSVQSVQQAKDRMGGSLPEAFVVKCPVIDIPELWEAQWNVTVLMEQVLESGLPWKAELTTVHDELASMLELCQETLVGELDKLRGEIPLLRALI